MKDPTNVDRAFEALKRCLQTKRLAHAYVVIGNPRADALDLACLFVSHLLELPSAKSRRDSSSVGWDLPRHPDLLWVEPKGKKRSIVVADVRELTRRMTLTAFQGGWKASVILGADRMTQEAGNASLKTLEEPPGKSCMLLVTESPEDLLPTIYSRCQRIFLSSGQQMQDSRWTESMLELLRAGPPKHVLQAVQRGSMMETMLTQAEKELKAQLEGSDQEDEQVVDARVSARLHELRSDLLRCMQFWFRDILVCVHGGMAENLHFNMDEKVLREQAANLTPSKALQNMDVLEHCIRRLERTLPPINVLGSAWVQFGRIALN